MSDRGYGLARGASTIALALRAGAMVLAGLVIMESAWAAQGSWVGRIPRQTVVMSERPIEGRPVQPPSPLEGAEVTRVRWVLRTDEPAPTLKVWLCQAQFCLPLAGMRGETQRFAGRSASDPFRWRFQLPPGSSGIDRVEVSGGQLLVDYRQ